MFSITTDVQKIAVQNAISGTLNLQVFQIGGKPSEIAKVISSKDPSGVYYILKCNLQNQTVCSKTVSDLLDYSSKNFPNQIDF